MAKYIDAEEALDEGTLQDWYLNSIDNTAPPVWTEEHIYELCNDFIVIPKEAPAAAVRPERHGVWEWSKLPNGYNDFKCSACGAREAATITPHSWVKDGYHEYCGVCGAKMDGGGQ